MKALYNKSQIWFSVLWIFLYVFLSSNADSLSESLGTAKLITAPLEIGLSLFLLFWLKKNDLTETYGLCAFKGQARAYLYFLPLVLIGSTNLWRGVALNMSVPESVLYAVSMLGVGFMEELLFRGFLFKAMCKKNVKTAVVVSSLTFGIGHIVNLLNGAELISTLLQIGYACAIGFLFTIIFLKGKSLFPCIATHCAVNCLSTVGREEGLAVEISISIVLVIIPLAYALWILKKAGVPAKAE